MNLEDAANIGEILGGLAILATLIFGLRQIIELNKSKEREAARDIANLLSSPMYQRAISIIVNELTDDFSLEDLGRLSREEKDMLNFMAINTNSIAIMTFDRQLSFSTVARFFQPLFKIISVRFRRLTEVLEENVRRQGAYNETDVSALSWSIWLIDRIEDLPPAEKPANVLYRNWKP